MTGVEAGSNPSKMNFFSEEHFLEEFQNSTILNKEARHYFDCQPALCRIKCDSTGAWTGTSGVGASKIERQEAIVYYFYEILI
jgi:hypothetical protein